jgi:DNA processing protein
MREWAAVCVTGAADVIEMLTPLGESGSVLPAPSAGLIPVQEGLWPETGEHTTKEPGPAGCGMPVAPAGDTLDPLTAAVLEAVPTRGGGPATIAIAAGLGVDAVVRSLGLLAAGGYVERCARGWRIRPSARRR